MKEIKCSGYWQAPVSRRRVGEGVAWWERDERELEGDAQWQQIRPGCLRKGAGGSNVSHHLAGPRRWQKRKRDRWASRRESRDWWTATIPGRRARNFMLLQHLPAVCFIWLWEEDLFLAF